MAPEHEWKLKPKPKRQMFDCHDAFLPNDRSRRSPRMQLPSGENRTNNARNIHSKHAPSRDSRRHRPDDVGNSSESDGSLLVCDCVPDYLSTDFEDCRNADEMWTVLYPAFGQCNCISGNECMIDLASKPGARVLHNRKSEKVPPKDATASDARRRR